MSSRIKNPPRNKLRFIPLPTPESKTARLRGGSEAYHRADAEQAVLLDPRFKATQPPDWWPWEHPRQKHRDLIPVAPFDARAQRHARRASRK